jgi:hypothetical protein
MSQLPVFEAPLIVVLDWYVSVPVVVVDLTVKVALPLVVVCGDDVRSVVFAAPAGLVLRRLNETENDPLFVAFLFASTMLAVAVEVEEPSLMMIFGMKEQAIPAAPPGVNTMVAVVEDTPVPSVKVTVQPAVANVEANVNVARPALLVFAWLEVLPPVPSALTPTRTLSELPSAFVPEQPVPSVAVTLC